MPYLAFELDAKKRVPLVARAAGVSCGDVAWALLELWEHAWSTASDTVTKTVLAGCVGLSPGMSEALCAFGFLEAVDGGFRVRGAERYLRVKQAQSAAGKAHASNLKRGTEPGKTKKAAPAPSRLPPGSPSGSRPALTPSTEHRAPSTESKSVAPDKPAPPPPAPGWQLLVDRMVQASPGYAFSGRDAKALKACLEMAKGDGEEVVTRWCRALTRTGFPLVRAIPELAAHWNHFGAVAQREALPVFDRTEEVQF